MFLQRDNIGSCLYQYVYLNRKKQSEGADIVSLYLRSTYKFRGGGSGGASASSMILRGAVFGRAPPHLLVSSTDLTAVASPSLKRKP